jgi:hypothetical protein
MRFLAEADRLRLPESLTSSCPYNSCHYEEPALGLRWPLLSDASLVQPKSLRSIGKELSVGHFLSADDPFTGQEICLINAL